MADKSREDKKKVRTLAERWRTKAGKTRKKSVVWPRPADEIREIADGWRLQSKYDIIQVNRIFKQVFT